jgi:hypothetical protein
LFLFETPAGSGKLDARSKRAQSRKKAARSDQQGGGATSEATGRRDSGSGRESTADELADAVAGDHSGIPALSKTAVFLRGSRRHFCAISWAANFAY